MLNIQTNINLKPFNTFGIEANANKMVEATNIADIEYFLHHIDKNELLLILGAGSNILFTSNNIATAFQPNIKGIEVVSADDNFVHVKVGAGEVWDNFVDYAVNNNLGGIENLSYIPGNVGACPIQNIGAYGVEVKNVITKVECININNAETVEYLNTQCQFAYRNSIFKHSKKGQYIITHVYFRLSKTHNFVLNYGNIKHEAQNLGILNLQTIRQAIINIRKQKLPDPTELGNAGSFFKNPVVANSIAMQISNKYFNAVFYPDSEGFTKIPAAFLIEQCGLKGFKNGRVGVHQNQPLVLVNLGNATGAEVLHLSQLVINKVKSEFGITLEREVNVV